METWKDVIGYEGLYEVSNTGNIRSVERYVPNGTSMRLVKSVNKPTRVNKHGYLEVSISKENNKNRKTIHRLVAQAFIHNPLNKPVVNHKDGNKLNNHVDNLEWCTISENTKHAFDHLGRKGNNGGMNKPVKMKDKNTGEIIKTFNSIKEAYLFVKGKTSSISQSIKIEGTSYGYKWEFIK